MDEENKSDYEFQQCGYFFGSKEFNTCMNNEPYSCYRAQKEGLCHFIIPPFFHFTLLRTRPYRWVWNRIQIRKLEKRLRQLQEVEL